MVEARNCMSNCQIFSPLFSETIHTIQDIFQQHGFKKCRQRLQNFGIFGQTFWPGCLNTFKRTINWNKYKSNASIQRPNQYLDYIVNPSFQEAKGLLVLSFGNNDNQTSYKRHFLPTVEIKEYVMIDGQNFFDQSVKNDLRAYDNI